MRKIFIISALLLAGCVTNEIQAQYAACETYSSWIQSAQCADAVATMHYQPRYAEIGAYRKLLIEKVTTEQVTDAEAGYLWEQKISEFDRQQAQARAASQDRLQAQQQLRQNNNQWVQDLELKTFSNGLSSGQSSIYRNKCTSISLPPLAGVGCNSVCINGEWAKVC